MTFSMCFTSFLRHPVRNKQVIPVYHSLRVFLEEKTALSICCHGIVTNEDSVRIAVEQL